jgi:hypothetical protein
VEYFKYLGNTTNDARESNSRIAMGKAAFNTKKTFYHQIGLKFREETSGVLNLEYSFVWC